jgi:hypothetical protein
MVHRLPTLRVLLLERGAEGHSHRRLRTRRCPPGLLARQELEAIL